MLSYLQVIFLIVSLFLSGCMNDNYKRPAVAVAKDWDVKDDFAKPLENKEVPYIKWWEDFNDPALEHLMRRGLKCNTNILMSKSRIEAAIGELKKVRNQWIPNMEFWTGYSSNPMYGFPGSVFVFVPSYFINFYQQYHEYKIARMSLGETRADDDVIKLTIISEIANSYFSYQAYRDYQRLLGVLHDDLAHMADIAVKMNQDGLIPDIEPHQIRYQVYEVDGQQHLTHKNIIRTRNALRYLINTNPGPIGTCKVFENLMLKPKVVHSVPMRVLCNRPDMKLAEYRLRKAFYNVKLARSPFLPRFEFDMYPGLKAGDSSYNFPSRYIKFNDQLLKVSVFKWSVLGEIDKAKGQRKAVFYQFLDTLRRALRDTSTAYINHDRATKNLQVIEHSTQELWVVYQRNQTLKQQQIISEFELLKSKIAYDRMKLLLNRAQLMQLLSIVRVYQEIAGGYAAE